MQAERFISRILDDEGLTDGLTDPEARLFIEWLVERVEAIADKNGNEPAAWKQVEALCKRARAIRRFVSLWCHRGDRGAATQLAGAERFPWPLPDGDCDDAYDMLAQILSYQNETGRC